LTELEKPNLDEDPILKADSIKYIATFRLHFSPQLTTSRVIPLLIRALEAKSQVVHTYAAACIEGILGVRFYFIFCFLSTAQLLPSESDKMKAYAELTFL